MTEAQTSLVKKRNLGTPKSTKSPTETRCSLLDSAQKHFAKRGFSAASVHDIARDAAVNVSLVNYHFGSKEGLFKACLARAGVDRLNVAERVLSSEPSSIDEVRVRLGLFIDEILVDGIKNPEISSILYRDLHAEFHLIEDVFKKTFLRCFHLLSEFLSVAKKKGILASWIDPNLSSMNIMGAVIHILRTDPIRMRLLNESILNEDVRTKTRDYLVKSQLEGLCFRP